jgi:hypothetical protein
MTENHDEPPVPRPPEEGGEGRLMRFAKSALATNALLLPVITGDLAKLPALERSAEVLRYSVLRIEYWLSPHGLLRGILRLSLTLALLLGLPTLIVGPVVLVLLEGVAAAAALLAATAANLAALSFSLIAAVIGFAVLTALIRTLSRPK